MTGKRLWPIALLVAIAVCCSCGMWWLAGHEKLPSLFLCFFAGINFFTFLLYALDKFAAKRNTWRIPERQLHFCELLGGWPGALLAQQIFRHKSSKTSFLKIFWCMAILNVALVAALIFAVGVLSGGLKMPISFDEIQDKLPGISKRFSPMPPPKQKSVQAPAQPKPMQPEQFNFFTYQIALKSGKELAAREVKHDGQWIQIVTTAGLHMEIPLRDVDSIRKINKQ